MLERLELRLSLLQQGPKSSGHYLLVPGNVIAAWELERTTEVEVEINGKAAGRRRLRREGLDWHLRVPTGVCDELSLCVGQRLLVSIRLAGTDIPDEMFRIMVEHPDARERWDELPAADQHKLLFDVRQAHLPKTRWARAADGLRVEAPVPADLAGGRVREPLRVQAHFPEDGPESRKALSAALDAVSRVIAARVMYDAWKSSVLEDGGDPALEERSVPRIAQDLWTREFRPEILREETDTPGSGADDPNPAFPPNPVVSPRPGRRTRA